MCGCGRGRPGCPVRAPAFRLLPRVAAELSAQCSRSSPPSATAAGQLSWPSSAGTGQHSAARAALSRRASKSGGAAADSAPATAAPPSLRRKKGRAAHLNDIGSPQPVALPSHTHRKGKEPTHGPAHTHEEKGKNKRKKGKKGGKKADSRPRRPRRAPGLGDNVVVGVQRLHHPAPREQAQPLRLAHLHQVLRGGEPGVGRGWEVNPCIRVLRSCICTRFCRGPRIGVGRQTPKGGEMCAGAPNLYISGNSCADKLH